MNSGQFNSETASEAGKKSKRGAGQRVKILNEFFEGNKENVLAILNDLQKQAKGGSLEAQKIYLSYCFGKPESTLDITSDGEQILGFNYFPSSKPEGYQTKSSGNGIQTKSGLV